MPSNENNMLEIGITGGIGAGKSVVCRVFQTLGIPVYDADSRAKGLMVNDPVLVENIKAEFGQQAYTPEGALNRAYLAKTAFHDPERLARLNALVHPRVGVDYKQWTKKNQAAPYLLKEAALLFESGSYQQLDYIITVRASVDVRVRRVLKRDPQRDEQQVRAIIGKQWSEEQRQGEADFVIDNSGGELLIPQVLNLHEQLLELNHRA